MLLKFCINLLLKPSLVRLYRSINYLFLYNEGLFQTFFFIFKLMSISPLVVAIFLSTLRCVNCAVRSDDVSNYFSSSVLRDYRNPVIDSVSNGDLDDNKDEKKDVIVEGIKNEILPQFSNLNLTQPLKAALLNDYYLTKPFTRGDVSNLYNLDFLGSGLVGSNMYQKNVLLPSRPNYNWLNRNITWPNLWYHQSLNSDSIPKMNSSGYNLCNNHMSHSDLMLNDSIKAKRSFDHQEIIGLESGDFKIIDNKPVESKEPLNAESKDLTRNKFDFSALNLDNNSTLHDDIMNKLKNLTSNIAQRLPSLSDIYVSKREKDLTNLFNTFNTSSLLKKYENSEKTF